MTRSEKKDIERLATSWLSHIPKGFFAPNCIHVYKSNLMGFLTDTHYARFDSSFLSDDNRAEVNVYYHMLIAMAETLFQLHSGLGYDPETWECKVC